MASRTGVRLRPVSVRVYSTRGGTSGYTFLVKRPARSISLRLEVSTFCETPAIAFFSSPNRRVPLISSRRIRTVHRFEIIVSVTSTGHCGSSFKSDGTWVRVSGRLVRDDSDAARSAMLEKMPELKNMYHVGDGKFEVLFLEDAEATLYSMTDAPKEIVG